MEHVMQIQIRINEEGALRNQRHAFTDRFTLVSELLQNARRAGAACIEIHHDVAAQILTVQDDGQGLDDFQKLLSLHESGWDAAIRDGEHPFGVGFSKCLYAATRCIVASNHQRVDIDTAAALAKAAVDVEQVSDAEAVPGTRVELHGVDLPDLGKRIEVLCQGFPVPVQFNGRLLERRFALAHLQTMPSPMGDVHLAGTRDGKYSHATMVYLQGFCVMQAASYSSDPVNVVHLDQRQFMARLPDRDKLIDEDVQHKRIAAELKACWRKTLEAAKAQLPPERFVETYFPAMRAWGHQDLLNDLDVLPTELCEAIVDYPIQDTGSDCEYARQVAAGPARDAVERGAVTLVSLDWVNADNAAHWMLARAKGYLVFNWLGLHAEHWALSHVRFLENAPVQVEAVSEQTRTLLDGRWVCTAVILCKTVRIRIGDDVVDITREGVCHQGSLYIPEGENSGASVRQVSSFLDEHDKFMDADLDADRDALADLLRNLRSVDPVQTLDSLLQDLQLGKYPLLHGRTFELTVGIGEAPGHSVTLVDPAPPAGAGEGHAGP
jgi:hypothetical protein